MLKTLKSGTLLILQFKHTPLNPKGTQKEPKRNSKGSLKTDGKESGTTAIYESDLIDFVEKKFQTIRSSNCRLSLSLSNSTIETISRIAKFICTIVIIWQQQNRRERIFRANGSSVFKVCYSVNLHTQVSLSQPATS